MTSMPAMYILFTNNEFNPGQAWSRNKRVFKSMVFCHFVQLCISYFSKDAATIVNHKVHEKGWHTINLKIKSNFLIWSIGFMCKLPCAQHYNLWFVYCLLTFWKSQTFFQGVFSANHALCMVSIQERFMMARVRYYKLCRQL